MKTRAFTLVETILASVLAIGLMMASVAVLQNMQTQTADLKGMIDKDMTWIETSQHMSRMVHSASYFTLADQVGSSAQYNTLILYNYNGIENGRYDNNAAVKYITYTAGATSATFKDVNATFAAETQSYAQKDGKSIEAIVTYSQPFASTLRLRCVVNVKSVGPPTWALVVGVKDNSPVNCCSVTEVFDASGRGTGYMFGCGLYGGTWLYPTDLYGKYAGWSSFFGRDAGYENYGTGYPLFIRQTFDNRRGGNPTGFIIAGSVVKAFSPIWFDTFILKTGTNGAFQWAANFGNPNQNNTYICGNTAHQTFDSSGAPSGYILGTSYQTAIAGYFYKFYYARLADSGAYQATEGIGVTGGTDYFGSGTSIVNASGTTTGYFMVGAGGASSSLYCAPLNASGALTGSSAIFPNYHVVQGAPQPMVCQTFDSANNPTGFMIASNYDTYPYYYLELLKLRADLTVEWSRLINTNTKGQPLMSIHQTFDKKVNGNPTGYIIGSQTYYPNRYNFRIIKITTTGAREWTRDFSKGQFDSLIDVMQSFDWGGNPDGYIIIADTYSYASQLSALGATGSTAGLMIKTDVNGVCNDSRSNPSNPYIRVYDGPDTLTYAYPPVYTTYGTYNADAPTANYDNPTLEAL